jgi:SAM-dependent methyltransferase
MNKKAIVRSGYNSIMEAYLSTRNCGSEDVRLLGDFVGNLPKDSLILDAGCGAGIPVSRILSRHFQVIGVDFAENQLMIAQKHVPNAVFICQDITDLGFRESSFDAICSYYAIIHIPRSEHANIYRRFYSLLKPHGMALLCLGATDLEEDIEDNYLGSRMYWSHFDAETNIRMIKASGFEIIYSIIIPDSASPGSNHLFILARKNNSKIKG